MTVLTRERSHPPDCPEWDYEHQPDWRTVLPQRSIGVLTDLADGTLDTLGTVLDTRPVHRRLFAGLTPDGHDYFAGHYRGEAFHCLKHYRVMVRGDPRVGAEPQGVLYQVNEFRAIVQTGIDALDTDYGLPRRDRLRYLIVFTCRVFELFLRIHPYADGNGHAARFVVWCVLGRYGHYPRRWTLEPRPADPPYTDAISRYRDGDKTLLEHFLASCLVP